jgi:hypothetical protein
MRDGRILAEDSPEDLLATHGVPTLEDVFLRICLSVDVTANGDAHQARQNGQTRNASITRRIGRRTALRQNASRQQQIEASSIVSNVEHQR